jgi:hypothetical protein
MICSDATAVRRLSEAMSGQQSMLGHLLAGAGRIGRRNVGFPNSTATTYTILGRKPPPLKQNNYMKSKGCDHERATEYRGGTWTVFADMAAHTMVFALVYPSMW